MFDMYSTMLMSDAAGVVQVLQGVLLFYFMLLQMGELLY